MEQMLDSVFICVSVGGVSVGKLLSTVGINGAEISLWCGLGQAWMKKCFGVRTFSHVVISTWHDFKQGHYENWLFFPLPVWQRSLHTLHRKPLGTYLWVRIWNFPIRFVGSAWESRAEMRRCESVSSVTDVHKEYCLVWIRAEKHSRVCIQH